MNEKTKDALSSFCRLCPDAKMIKAYESQPNDNRRLMELAYLAYTTNDSVEVRDFLIASVDNNDRGFNEDSVREWAESAHSRLAQYRSCVSLLDNLGYLKK